MRKEPLTERQAEVLKAIKDFHKKHGCMPTYQELAEVCNTVDSSIYLTVTRIAEKGWIKQDRRPRRLKIL